jgi:PAS domain S-box-containing protein
MFPVAAHAMVPGVSYEELVRLAAQGGQIAGSAGHEAEWIAGRMALHRGARDTQIMQSSDGRWLRVSEHATREGGRVGLRTDVTELKHAREAVETSQVLLSESEAQYRRLFDSHPAPMWVYDPATLRFLAVNDAAIASYGYSREAFQALTIRDIRPAEALPELDRTLAVLRSNPGHPSAQGVWKHRKQDGRIIDVEISSHDLRFMGRPARLVMAVDVTEHRRAQQELLASQRLLQTVFDTIPHHLIVKDRESRYLMVNKAWCETFGRAPEEVLHRTALEVSGRPREEIERIPEEDRRALSGESILTPMQPVLTVKTGDRRFFTGIKTPLRDEAGAIVGLVAVSMDVTPEIESRQKADTAHARLIDAIESLPAAFYMYDPEERLVLWNSRTGEFYPEMVASAHPGQTFEQALRLAAGAFAEGNGEEWIAQRLAQFREHPGTIEHELKDGRWIQGIDRRTADGGTVCLRFDVTERKRQELAVRQSEGRYRTLVEESLQGLMIVQRGKLVFANRATARMFGYENAEEMIGMEAIDVVHPQDRHAALQVGSAEMRAGDPKLYRYYRGVRKDGSHMRYEAHRSDTQWQGRRAIQWALMDVTQEFALQQQLESSQRMESVGRLAGGIAHDFNNILTVILAHIGFILDGLKDSPALSEDALVVRDAGTRAAALTRQLLAFSRRQILEMRIVNLNEQVSGTQKMLSRVIGEDITLRTALARAVRPIRADVTQIEQVLMNLVVNARDAMPRGGSITLETANVTLDEAYSRAHLEVKPGDYVMLAVTDTGMGMDPETQRRIFEPFFTTKPQGQGTGLGLATVYGIVKQMNGSIFVYSEPGQGATFKIYFPVALDVVIDGTSEAVKPPAAQPTETVLLVEDDELVRRSAQRILAGGGYRVIVATTPEEALAIARAGDQPFDLLFTDVVMPGMSGSELWEAVRQVRDVRVLFMSGYTDDSIVRHGILEGKVPFLTKPFTKQSLLDKVRDVLGAGG